MKPQPLAAMAAFVFLQTVVSTPAHTQPAGPRLAVHVQGHVSKSTCTTDDPTTMMIPCGGFTTAGDLKTGYDVYLVVGQADSLGVAGATFGICYEGTQGQGVDVTEWNLCATGLEFPQTGWPAAGTGNVVTWNTAQCGDAEIPPDGLHGTVGAFYVYAYSLDVLALTPHLGQQGGPNLKVADCNGAERDLDPEEGILGWAGFGGEPGCNPCTSFCPPVDAMTCVTPVEPISWGGIKAKYR